jgi:hypothetical protein
MDDESTPISFEPMNDKSGTIIGIITTIPKPEHDRKYILVWKPKDLWYGKVRFSNATISMPDAKVVFLRKKYNLDTRVPKLYSAMKEV